MKDAGRSDLSKEAGGGDATTVAGGGFCTAEWLKAGEDRATEDIRFEPDVRQDAWNCRKCWLMRERSSSFSLDTSEAFGSSSSLLSLVSGNSGTQMRRITYRGTVAAAISSVE